MKNIITAAVLAAATFTATSASAYTAKDCPSIAEAAGAIAQGRDDGLSLNTSKARSLLAPTISSNLKDNTMKNTTTRTSAEKYGQLAFETPELTPAIMEALTLHTCVDHFSTDS